MLTAHRKAHFASPCLFRIYSKYTWLYYHFPKLQDSGGLVRGPGNRELKDYCKYLSSSFQDIFSFHILTFLIEIRNVLEATVGLSLIWQHFLFLNGT